MSPLPTDYGADYRLSTMAERDNSIKARTRIDPFKVARACNRNAALPLKLQAKLSQIDRERASPAQRKIDVLVPIACAPITSNAGKLPARSPIGDLIGDAGLDDGLLLVELGVAFDV